MKGTERHLQLSENTQYAVEQTHIVAIRNSETCSIHYPESAIWDFLVRQYPKESIIHLMRKVARITETHAEHFYNDLVEMLIQRGFVHWESGNG